MTMTTVLLLLVAAAAAAGTAALVLALRLNRIMKQTPREALPLVGEPMTEEAAREAYARVGAGGMDFRGRHPGRLERRYIVVGAGLVGCQIALDLIDGGNPPEAIRLIDIQRPFREEFAPGGRAGRVSVVHADVTSETSTAKAFEEAWPASTAHLPLTVFHTAAVIRPYERHELLYHRCWRVNVAGTANALACARRVGADVFILTSSSHAGSRSVAWSDAVAWPWRGESPRGLAQVLDETDFASFPLKKQEQQTQTQRTDFPSNYARSKAEAEQLVCAANDPPGFRTGCIRPGNGIYGHVDDAIIGRILRAKQRIPTFSAPWVQSWVHVRNVSLAHLLLEKELLGSHAASIAGRPFVVTDKGPLLRFQDLYLLLGATSRTGLQVGYPPPVLVWMASHLVEWYCVLLARWPCLGRMFGLREPTDPLLLLQPGTVDSSVTHLARDEVARRRPEEGGLGYEAYCSTVEGICLLVREWNERQEVGKDG
ncbi:hypothetical protein E4U55_001698 [Claviceps digitariae]|nr:hypothetical protein E4U55_001698 [Claviceps digitariae]